MTTYNWQQPDWPRFRYDESVIQDALYRIAEKTGLIAGKLLHLPKSLQTEAMIDLMVEEAVKTSEIEGEYINRPDVRSSIINKLGLTKETVHIHDKRAMGIAELMINARETYNQPLTEETLFDWHLMLFSGTMNPNLRIGSWRIDEEPMQIVSGQAGKRVVYYEAPPAQLVPAEMKQFTSWFNDTAPYQTDAIKCAPIRAAIAHLYFESIHPFDDGNGRIGRAIAEKALSQGLGFPVNFSISQAIESDKKSYYDALHTASRSNEMTAWLQYFTSMILRAQAEVVNQVDFIIRKAALYDRCKNLINERQLKVIKRMFKAGMQGFEGGMSARKYMIIAGTSKATATRDLQELVELNVFKQMGSGRSVRYELNI